MTRTGGSPEMAIDMQGAVVIAEKSFEELLGKEPHWLLSLEEAELSDDDRYWHVTLGYSTMPPNEEDAAAPNLADWLKMARPKLNRRFKVFKIDASNGTLRSLKDAPL